MQQRRVRLGDILDDYCPRERRITNHAVVAMIEDEVKQTRCTTCDADHEYKQAKVPAPRRKKPEAAPGEATLLAGTEAAAFARPPVPDPEPPLVIDESLAAPIELLEDVAPAAEIAAEPEAEAEADAEPEPSSEGDDEWPVHRPLIRATLPRPEGQAPERKAPDFTIRQNGRFDGRNNGNRHRGQRQAHGQARFGTPRSGSGQGGQSGHGQRHGNRQGGPQGGQRSGGGRPSGHGRGQGRGPKRGR
jgi:uncharacterized membrane protein YgcG